VKSGGHGGAFLPAGLDRFVTLLVLFLLDLGVFPIGSVAVTFSVPIRGPVEGGVLGVTTGSVADGDEDDLDLRPRTRGGGLHPVTIAISLTGQGVEAVLQMRLGDVESDDDSRFEHGR